MDCIVHIDHKITTHKDSSDYEDVKELIIKVIKQWNTVLTEDIRVQVSHIYLPHLLNIGVHICNVFISDYIGLYKH